MNTLLTLKIGQSGRVTDVRAENQNDQRLMSLGIATGVVVKVCKVAPLGDPIAIEVDGTHIVLRKTEASGISIEPLS